MFEVVNTGSYSYGPESRAVKLKRVGPYLLGGVLGTGSFGKVREGIHSETLKRVAIKICTLDKLRKTPGAEDRVRKEVSILKSLRHPNVCALIETMSVPEKRKIYVVLEYVGGGTLQALLNKAPMRTVYAPKPLHPKPGHAPTLSSSLSKRTDSQLFIDHDDSNQTNHASSDSRSKDFDDEEYEVRYHGSPSSFTHRLDTAPVPRRDSQPEKRRRLTIAQARALFVQLVDALEYLQSRGIVHGDIKPDNILLTTDGVLKLSDFGSASRLDAYDSSDMTKSVFGSPAFYAPEIASGSEQVSGFKTDIWAAGVTLYYMICGELPFKGGNLFDLLEQIEAAEFTVPDEILREDPSAGRDLLNVLKGCLAREEDDRFDITALTQSAWISRYQRVEPSTPEMRELFPELQRKKGKGDMNGRLLIVLAQAVHMDASDERDFMLQRALDNFEKERSERGSDSEEEETLQVDTTGGSPDGKDKKKCAVM